MCLQVWISFARFELGCGEGSEAILQARHVYEKANKSLRSANEKEERLMLLEAWKEFEVYIYIVSHFVLKVIFIG